MDWDVRPEERKAEDAHRLRGKAREMLRLARQTTMPDVAQELIEMAQLLHRRATNAEAAMSPASQRESNESTGQS